MDHDTVSDDGNSLSPLANRRMPSSRTVECSYGNPGRRHSQADSSRTDQGWIRTSRCGAASRRNF